MTGYSKEKVGKIFGQSVKTFAIVRSKKVFSYKLYKFLLIKIKRGFMGSTGHLLKRFS